MSRGRSPWGPAAVAAVALTAGLYVAAQPAPAPPVGAPDRPPAPPEVSALLGGLDVGDRVLGWTVTALDGPSQGQVVIGFGRDTIGFSITVARKGAVPQAAPLATDVFDIFYGHPRPHGTKIPQGATRALTHEVARRLEANEDDVDVPGL